MTTTRPSTASKWRTLGLLEGFYRENPLAWIFSIVGFCSLRATVAQRTAIDHGEGAFYDEEEEAWDEDGDAKTTMSTTTSTADSCLLSSAMARMALGCTGPKLCESSVPSGSGDPLEEEPPAP